MSRFTEALNTFQQNLLVWLYWLLEAIQLTLIGIIGYYVIVDVLPPVVKLIENSQ